MLAREHRMLRHADFQRALTGRRAGRSTLVAHFARPLERTGSADSDGTADRLAVGTDPRALPPLVGFIVSRAVGGAATRNRVRRRLRHLVASYVPGLPAGSLLVLRALPASAAAPRATLAADLDSALLRVLAPAAPGARR